MFKFEEKLLCTNVKQVKIQGCEKPWLFENSREERKRVYFKKFMTNLLSKMNNKTKKTHKLDDSLSRKRSSKRLKLRAEKLGTPINLCSQDLSSKHDNKSSPTIEKVNTSFTTVNTKLLELNEHTSSSNNQDKIYFNRDYECAATILQISSIVHQPSKRNKN